MRGGFVRGSPLRLGRAGPASWQHHLSGQTQKAFMMIRKPASSVLRSPALVRLLRLVAASLPLAWAAPASAGIVSTFDFGLTTFSGSGTELAVGSGDMVITSGTGAVEIASGASVSIDHGGALSNGGSFRLVSGATGSNHGQINTSGQFGIAAGTRITGSGNYQQSAGTTTVNGQLSQGSISINGGLLTGGGSVSASTIAIGSGATVAPGGLTMNGSLAFDGLLSLSINSALQLGGLTVNGLLDFGSAARIQIDSSAVLTADSYDWVFVTASGGIADFLPGQVTVTDFAGYTETVTRECAVNDRCSLHLRVALTPVSAAVPEPGSVALVALALGLAAWGWSRGGTRPGVRPAQA